MSKDIIENPEHWVKFPTAFNTVDIFCLVDGKVLLGKKKQDGNKWRFPGGFVDPNDQNILSAAIREFYEETKCMFHAPTKLFDRRIEDSRYVGTPHSVITHVYLIRKISGTPEASDDLDQLTWMPLDNLRNYSKEILIPNHNILFQEIRNYI